MHGDFENQFGKRHILNNSIKSNPKVLGVETFDTSYIKKSAKIRLSVIPYHNMEEHHRVDTMCQ